MPDLISDKQWRDIQAECFSEKQPNSIIRARAGCRKTSALVAGLKTVSKKTLYSVFNKKNQIEAQGKISNPNVAIQTLHSVGYGFVRNNWRGVKASGYTEFGRAKALFPDAPKQIHFQTASLVSYLKNLFISPTIENAKETCLIRGIDGGNHANEYDENKIAEMALKVIDFSKEYPRDKQISFDDMIWLPSAMGWVRPSFDLVCIDEAQDCNLPQLDMVTKASGGRICMVGDDRQAIYNFRGAMENSIDFFKEKLNGKEYPLTVSFRCPKKVVGMAQQLVPDFLPWNDAIEGEIKTKQFGKMVADVQVGDVILSRKNAPLMMTCLNLIRKGKPAYVEGKDVARQLINVIKEINAFSINQFIDKLTLWRDIKVAGATGWTAAARIELVQDIYETLKVVAESCMEVADIEPKINSLFQDSEYNRIPSVICSSVHKAKGLEWNNVNVLSDSFTGRRAATPAEIKEEQNIYYVALTRSKQNLNLVSGLAEKD